MTAQVTPEALIDDWQGPYGGVPPFDRATPELIEQATMIALERKRAEVASIARNPAAPTFENTIEALEDSGRALRRADCLRASFFSLRALGEMPRINQRLTAALAALDDEIAHDDVLFARIEAVHRERARLSAEQARLTEVVHERMVRLGAGLAPVARSRLKEVNALIARAQSKFHENLMAESAEVVVRVEAESELDGLPEAMRVAAAKLAERKGHPGQWAIANARPAVWPVLQFATHRGLRRRVRDMWMNRCAYDGPFDNRPVIAEILKLRGEKARLLGYPSFAHWATAGRMAGTPDAALDQMLRTWRPVREETNRRLAELQVLADADGLDGPIEAWDWLFYMERLRRQRFGLDGNAVKPYLQLDNVLRAVMDAAGRLHGLQSRELDGLPTIHPDVRVFEVSREGDPLGVIWLDLLARDGKMRGSWQYELRAAESFRGRTIGLSNVCSSLERTGDGGPVLMGWEYANVLFHEFGHALHMIMSRARYPSLGSMAVAWDLVEVPSQLNERWLRDRELLRRYAVHVETGEPMPDAMIDAIEAAAQFDRVVSVGLEYLAPAIVDMRIHLAADSSDVDALRIEREVYAELGMPAALDAIMRLPHQYHSFTDVYAAGLYVYLWADVMVAELLGAFAGAPGGLYDEQVARRYRDTILCVGHSVKGQEAFRNFLGRDPDPDALLRRFRLA